MLPRTAYVLLWFPKPSETFVLREACGLAGLGLPLTVFTLYGTWSRDLSQEMRACTLPVERLGLTAIPRLTGSLLHWTRRAPVHVGRLVREAPLRHWRALERAAENLWAVGCAFELARRCERLGIEHIHAPWANGPATAAWLAARLIGVPFSFTGRSRDIFPPDEALAAKIRDAIFVRTDVPAHVPHLASLAGPQAPKVRSVLSGLPLRNCVPAPVVMEPPYHLVALGRFVRKKGFAVLLEACRLLVQRDIPFRLTLAGGRDAGLERLACRLGLGSRVTFPGFLSHDEVPALLSSADVFVMPSVVAPDGDRDGIPNVVVEALAHRLPVVGTIVGGIPDVVRDGLTGLLVPGGDAPALARAIERMASDRTAALGMAAAGEAFVREHFDPARCQAELLDLFVSTAHGPKNST